MLEQLELLVVERRKAWCITLNENDQINQAKKISSIDSLSTWMSMLMFILCR